MAIERFLEYHSVPKHIARSYSVEALFYTHNPFAYAIWLLSVSLCTISYVPTLGEDAFPFDDSEEEGRHPCSYNFKKLYKLSSTLELALRRKLSAGLPDLSRVHDLIQDSFEELCAPVGTLHKMESAHHRRMLILFAKR